ncbi:B12-binding domain-containing radical SAM protein [Hydromonas duriensis]|uniref:Radical SAM superfamily enzyme YgiQ (UPF0313 family) n=1 Tax=Hydromonas duriensis TaxID=1527608 RepID=A0A4R6YAP1_9BURK|nr:DUF4080 domain-containing protein [Hydromonas duriensis]TDR32586.1 radical SAM superfamily enzyme YgiQ (UPF0313 family) [Hydromonas duriensis]
MITLATLNARYSHASLGLRYLLANLGEHAAYTRLAEYTIKTPLADMCEDILKDAPRIIGLGVYIWNVNETLALIEAIRARAPQTVIILGGPEVSYEVDAQAICKAADYIVTGWGEVTLPKLLTALIHGPKPLMKVHAGEQPPLNDIALPYELYTDHDLKHRNIYVEASRGCPFKCEFCLSSLDKTAWAFDLDVFLIEMNALYARGARTFKFVDRTFNLKPETGRRILDFFLEKITAAPDDPLFVHFEVIPDHLPELLKSAIAQYPAGSLQFELGIQTLNTTVQKHISRKTNLTKAQDNITWLREHSQAHLHVDLIAGLPSETMQSFAEGFDRLYSWRAHEIQLGILKRLRGTPIIRHTKTFKMVYSDSPPYEIISTADVTKNELDDFKHFAKYWDNIANSGRFNQTLPLILGDAPYARFNELSQYLHAQWQRSHSIALERLYTEVANWLIGQSEPHAHDDIRAAVTADYVSSGSQGKLPWMARGLTIETKQRTDAALARQARHQMG